MSRERVAFVGAHISAAARAQLLELARAEDRSMAAVIRRALERELARANTNETGDDT